MTTTDTHPAPTDAARTSVRHRAAVWGQTLTDDQVDGIIATANDFRAAGFHIEPIDIVDLAATLTTEPPA